MGRATARPAKSNRRSLATFGMTIQKGKPWGQVPDRVRAIPPLAQKQGRAKDGAPIFEVSDR